MGKVRAYLSLVRPVNCIMVGFAVIVGAALADPASIAEIWPNLAFGFITGFVLTGASMAINDYYDRDIDAINQPDRPITSGAITPSEALSLAFALTIIGFFAAYLTNPTYPLCLVVSIVAWMVFVTYTTVGKRSGLPGNLLVSVCVTIPLIYGSVAAVNSIANNVLIFVGMVFLANTGREITKGIVDIKGDKSQGVKTLAVRYGEKAAAVAAAVFYVCAVGLSPIPWALGGVSFWFVPLVGLTDFGLVAAAIMILKNQTREDARRIKNAVLLWFIVGLCAFFVGAFG